MSDSPKGMPSNTRIIAFIIILSVVCATILSLLASVLAKPQQIARDLDRSKQMMIAGDIMNHQGYFLIQELSGKDLVAKVESSGLLVADPTASVADRGEIIQVYRHRFRPLLVNEKGETTTFSNAGIDMDTYVAKYKKEGYYKQPLKLVYEILPNEKEIPKDPTPIGYVIPINGYGLWDAIYGYLAIEPNGNTVIGTTWYEQKETPGLGANIADADWQAQFHGKHIFQASPDGETDFKTAPLGIIVVRGKVSEVLGQVPKAKSAVDGIAGATLTGNGVTAAYKDVLSSYRPFLLRLHEKFGKNGEKKN